MATGKKFYWIKLRKDFMEGDIIDFLMGQENGAEYVVLYQMLCMKCINTNGVMANSIGEVIVPYDVKKIQRDCKYFSIDTVICAMELFRKLGLIYEQEDGILAISNFSDLVGYQTDYAIQKANQRKSNNISHSNNGMIGVDNVHSNVHSKNEIGVDNVHTEIEIEKELELELEKEKDIELEKELDIELDNKEKYKKKGKMSEENKSIIENVVNFLNEICGTNYKASTRNTVSHINARLDEGFCENDFFIVIEKKYKEWHGTEMEKFLRPATLFGTKFESYLNQKIVDKEEQKQNEWMKMWRDA